MYTYEDERSKVFTEDGQKMFLKIRNKVKELLNTSGAFTVEKAISGTCGDTWTMMACIDRLVELKEIKKVADGSMSQHSIYTRGQNA